MSKVFISYSWDNEDHKIWVKKLADKLINAGIETLLDQYEIKIGDSFTQFMEKSIEESKYTIVVLTPNYKKKSTERKGGVGYEQQIISGEIMSLKERNKFIPILKNGEYDIGEKCAIPPHFKGIATIDFRENSRFEDNFELLIRTILNRPKSAKPKLGKHPYLETELSVNDLTKKTSTLNHKDKSQFTDRKAIDVIEIQEDRLVIFFACRFTNELMRLTGRRLKSKAYIDRDIDFDDARITIKEKNNILFPKKLLQIRICLNEPKYSIRINSYDSKFLNQVTPFIMEYHSMLKQRFSIMNRSIEITKYH